MTKSVCDAHPRAVRYVCAPCTACFCSILYRSPSMLVCFLTVLLRAALVVVSAFFKVAYKTQCTAARPARQLSLRRDILPVVHAPLSAAQTACGRPHPHNPHRKQGGRTGAILSATVGHNVIDFSTASSGSDQTTRKDICRFVPPSDCPLGSATHLNVES